MSALPRMPSMVESIADTLKRTRPEFEAQLAAEFAKPLHCEAPQDARYGVAWSDEPLRVVGADLVAAWWPDAPQERAKVQRLRIGESYVDPDTDERGVPVCMVVRIS